MILTGDVCYGVVGGLACFGADREARPLIGRLGCGMFSLPFLHLALPGCPLTLGSEFTTYSGPLFFLLLGLALHAKAGSPLQDHLTRRGGSVLSRSRAKSSPPSLCLTLASYFDAQKAPSRPDNTSSKSQCTHCTLVSVHHITYCGTVSQRAARHHPPARPHRSPDLAPWLGCGTCRGTEKEPEEGTHEDLSGLLRRHLRSTTAHEASRRYI